MVLFSDLNEDDFKLIHEPIDDLTFNPGEALYRQSEQGQHAFTIRSGLVKLIQLAADGSQRIVRLAKRGDLIGQESLLNNPYNHHAIVMEPVTSCRLPANVIHRLIDETPRLHKQLMSRCQQTVSDSENWITQLSTGDARSRMARLLIYLSEINDNGEFHAPSREDMGAMIAVAMETASRLFAEFKREGLVSKTVSGTLQINHDQLELISNDSTA